MRLDTSFSFSGILNSLMSRIPDTLINDWCVCVPCCLSGFKRQDSLRMLSRAHVTATVKWPQVKVGRVRLAVSKATKPVRFVSFHLSIETQSKGCFSSWLKWAGALSCTDHRVCHVCKSTSTVSETILLLPWLWTSRRDHMLIVILWLGFGSWKWYFSTSIYN